MESRIRGQGTKPQKILNIEGEGGQKWEIISPIEGLVRTTKVRVKRKFQGQKEREMSDIRKGKCPMKGWKMAKNEAKTGQRKALKKA